MSFNLVESVKDLLPGDLLNRAAGMLGENPANVQQAVNGIIPSILTGVLHKAGSGDVHSVLNMAADSAKSGIPENLGVLSGGGGGLGSKAADILKNLFGDKVVSLTNAISGFSGISSQSASTLLGVAAPAAMGVLGKQVTDSNLNAGGLLSFLNAQKDNILNALPSDLNLPEVLGLGSLSGIAGKLSGAVPSVSTGIGRTAANVADTAHATTEQAKSGSRWLLPVLLILVLVGIIWYFMNRHSPASDVPVMADTVSAANDTAAAAPLATGPEQIKVKLPDGKELNAFKGGIEDQLVNFLNDPNSRPGKDVWFDFDNLNFKTGSADISNESIDQIQNIGAILKAYPKLKIKIGGYTDRTGDSVKNKKLSQDRAASVAAALKGAGGKTNQITGAEGYGSAFARAAADAPDSARMKDRHISISVRAK
ncbi:MAG: OmpA family protein [Bacteroidota bacterium]|nr:OmpA family protein [Bacteroidota bacterium]